VSTLQLLIVCFTALALAVIYAGTRAGKAVQPLVSEGRVLCYLDNSQSVEGVVIAGPEGFVTLAGATLRSPNVKPTAMGGAVKLRETAITLVQEVDATRGVEQPTVERPGLRSAS
jgi:hypothetical protein